jgi:PAS domain S-box-containing protein
MAWSKRAAIGAGERLQTLAAEAPVGIFEMDGAGDCVYVNRLWCQLAGLTPEEAAGRGWLRAVHPDDRARVVAAWYGGATASREATVDFRFRTQAGVPFLADWCAVDVLDPDGTVRRLAVTHTDPAKSALARGGRRRGPSRGRVDAGASG